MITKDMFQKFLPEIKKLKKLDSLEKEHLITENFLLEKENKLAVYYSPHNEYINTMAKIVIVGITPGFQQMKTAYTEIINSLDDSLEQMLIKAKVASSFSGTMRKNLINMLQQCGLADFLQMEDCAQLFTTNRSILHTTSILKYPVFINGKNYTGYSPVIHRSSLLKKYAYHVFPQELNNIDSSALIIPLGKVTEEVFRTVYTQITGEKQMYVSGFPHP